jgi:hypothetical protein
MHIFSVSYAANVARCFHSVKVLLSFWLSSTYRLCLGFTPHGNAMFLHDDLWSSSDSWCLYWLDQKSHKNFCFRWETCLVSENRLNKSRTAVLPHLEKPWCLSCSFSLSCLCCLSVRWLCDLLIADSNSYSTTIQRSRLLGYFARHLNSNVFHWRESSSLG